MTLNYGPAATRFVLSDDTGIIEGVDPQHVAAMIKMGCWKLPDPNAGDSNADPMQG